MHKLGEDVERFLTPTESLPSLNFTLDATGRVLAVNPVGLQHLGYGVEDAIAQPIFSLFHPEDRARLQRELRALVQTSNRIVQGQLCLLSKGGSILPVNVTLQALQGIARHTVFLLTCQGMTVVQDNRSGCESDYVYDFDEIANPYSEFQLCQRIKEEQPATSTSLRQAQERVAKINECFLSFSSDPIENINRLTALAGTLLGATCALYNRLDRGMLCSIGQWQPPCGCNAIEIPDIRICWDAIQRTSKQPIVIRNLPDIPHPQTDPNVKRYRLRTYIGQAVKGQGVCIGALCTVHQDNFMPSDDDKKLLAMIASAIGVEEERRQADEALALRHRELLALHKISEIHLSNRSLKATFQEIVEEISTATGFPIVAIEIYDKSRQMMVFEAVKGIELPPNTDVLEVPVDETFSGTVVQTGQPAIKVYAPQDAKACDGNETLKQLDIRTFICMPMSVSDRAIGTVSLAHPEALQLDDYLIQWLASLANYLAFLIERKRSEEALRESEVRLHRVLQNMPVMLDAFDSHGNIIVWNRECERVTGYSADEIVGNPRARELLYPDSDYRQRMMAAWAERGHQYRDWEWKLTCKDGTVKTIAWSNVSQQFPIPGWAAWSVGMDVTKRQQAEAALRQQKEVLQTIFEHLPVMLAFFDPQGNLQWINQAWEQTLGWKLEELQTSDSFAEFYLDPDYYQNIIDFIQSATPTWGDFKTRIRDGRTIDTAWANVKLSDGSTIGIGQDITERKQAEESLRQRAEREQLIASITQHIRQSLNLEEILDTTVAEVRQFLQADRVLVYRLKADGTGSAVTEAVVSGWPTVLSRTFPEEVFPHEFHQRYSQGRICAICDLEQAQVHPCLQEFLQQFQVRAKLVVPILQGEELWGLLIAHQCSSPRQWQPFEIDLLKQLAAQVAIAIQQSQLYQKTQLQAQREQMLNRVIQTIRKSLDLKTIFSTATAEIAQLLKAERSSIVQYLPEQNIGLHVADYCQTPDLPSARGVEIPDEDNEAAA
ncbi:MAG TPA: GAF domain-containing protein, partial [Allocoleopsis sp.]